MLIAIESQETGPLVSIGYHLLTSAGRSYLDALRT